MYVYLSNISFSLDYSLIWPFFAFSLSLIISYFCFPVIIRVSKMKKLMAKPNQRSVHKIKTPNLGGIGIFISLNLIITFLGNYFEDSNLSSLLGALTILFFTGLIDDLINIKPTQKIFGQVVASLCIILIANVRIESLYGLFGIYELPYLLSVSFSIFVFILMINAYNLIDGVDGLAGSFAITTTLLFGVFYFMNKNDSMFFLSICIIGSLISFLIFNFSKKEKIFMGDTGSMIVGFLLCYQAIMFINVDFNPNFLIKSTKSPIYILALFSFPLLDTGRVFMLRILKNKSPFSADKNHIHHVFLKYGLEHWKISLMVSVFTIAMVFSVFIFNDSSMNKQAVFLIVTWTTCIVVISNLKMYNKLKRKSKKVKAIKNEEPIKNTTIVKSITFKDLA